jgi:GntR family transcriptional regulator/MocR family aminotransferase
MTRATKAPADEASWLRLERGHGETLRFALERSLRDAIREGALRAGVRLPSSRRLADQLGVSRGVTSDVYGQLEAQGFIVVTPRSAPVVADVAPRVEHPQGPLPDVPRAAAYDMEATTPDLTLFPARDWLAALTRAVRAVTARSLDYGDPRGDPGFRETLADHLGRSRGVVARPEQIVVVQGYRQGIDLLLRVLAARGARRIGVEDPSMQVQRQQLAASGLATVACAVDDEGASVAGVDADAVIVTPAHQLPAGVVLSGERRRAVLAWARVGRRLVVEDDYDAEFRYDREPVRALQGLEPDRVAYLGTISKSLAPALRLGWLIVPVELVDAATQAKLLLDAGSPVIDQLALRELIERGDYDRHIRRVRGVYQARRDRLAVALDRHLPGLPVAGVTAGLHVTVRLPPEIDDRRVADAAFEAGVDVSPLSKYAVERRDANGLVIGYGRIHASAIDRAVGILATAVARAG